MSRPAQFRQEQCGQPYFGAAGQSSKVRQWTLHHVAWLHAGQRMRRVNSRPGIGNHNDGTMRMPSAVRGTGERASHAEHSRTTAPLRRGAAENNA